MLRYELSTHGNTIVLVVPISTITYFHSERETQRESVVPESELEPNKLSSREQRVEFTV